MPARARLILPALPFLLSASLVAAATRQPQASANPADSDKAAVVAVVQAFLDAMQHKDVEAFRMTMLPDGAVHSVDMRAGRETQPVRGRATADDVQWLATTPDALLERIWDPDVRVHRRIATLWAPYDFWLNGAFSHCGIDIFTLVRTDVGWRISAIAYTVETEACPASPLGEPTREQLGPSI